MPLNRPKFVAHLAVHLFVLAYGTTLLHAEITVDDARVLLDGIRASRLELREGAVKFRIRDEVPIDSFDEEYTLSVEWKDDSLRSTEVLSDGTERRCSIRSDGELIFRQDGYGGMLDDASKGYAYPLFDPRLIGAYPILAPVLYSSACLFPDTGWEIEILQESETIDGHDCVVVRWKQDGVAQDYWIDKRAGFRVKRIYDHNNDTLTESVYSAPHALPTEVVVTKFAPNKAVFRRTKYELISFKQEPVDSDAFSLSGLNLDIGTDVVDQRLHQSVGFWNGEGLSDSRAEAFAAAAALEPMSSRGRGRIIMLAVGSVALILAIMILLRRVKPSLE